METLTPQEIALLVFAGIGMYAVGHWLMLALDAWFSYRNMSDLDE